MARPTKGNFEPNQAYLKEWDEYQLTSPRKKPILLPISVSLNKGVVTRFRIKSTDLAAKQEDLMKEFEAHCKNPDGYLEDAYTPSDFEEMLDDYIRVFSTDNKQSPFWQTPLDLKISRPVWILFHLPDSNIKFSQGRQFSTENDRDDFGRNFEKITTFEKNDWLLLANHCRSKPKGLKYNLHVTITQKIDGVTMKTPIVIDPGSDNDDRNGGGQQGLP